MADAQHDRLEQLFGAALDKHSTAERIAFLDGACGDDPLLRATVESLLRAHDDAGSFLDKPAVDPDATIESSSSTEVTGTKIGRYKVLQQIGEGGFGCVYMAEQEEPVRRKVALKIIKLGMDTKQVIARFEAERQALALMDHPNIAKVFDAGATEGGRPYFVMELVKGIAITEYCDKNKLPTGERIDLFVQVCHAVQHAHQKGVIHRDIKPNNVLVTLHDSRPVPKVIDFGIAKATSQRLTEKTLFTEFHQFIGTPEYMSPDQAEISGLDVDTRTDIYSLGVLLYELLTGTTPFDAQTLRQSSYAEIQRIIREVEPPKPSTRMATLAATGTDIGLRRQVEPAALSKLMRGDLDWIVMKAMDKDRTHRYATAHDLACDLERHLSNEPVLAGPPSVTYKLRKFVQRHRVGVLAGSLAAAAVLIGLSLATVGLVQTMRAKAGLQLERDAAEAARVQAEHARAGEQQQRELAETNAARTREEAAKSAAASEFLRQMLASVDPSKALGREVTVRYMLDEAAKEIEGGVLAGQPEVEAGVRVTIGETYETLGLYSAAETQLRAAEAIGARSLGEDHADVLRSRSALVGVLECQRRHVEAEVLARETIAAQQRVLGPEHPDVLATMSKLGVVLWRQDKYAEAGQIHRRTLELQRRMLGDEHIDTLRSLVNLGAVLQAQGKHAQAETILREALEVERRVLGEEHPDTANAMDNLALTLERQSKHAEAEALYRQAWELNRRVLGADHPRTQIPLDNLVRVLRIQWRVAETRPLIAEQIARRRRAAEQPDADATTLNAYALLLLTCVPADLRDPEAALPIALRAAELDGGQDASILDTLAVAYQMTGDLDLAIQTQREAVAHAQPGGPYNRSDLEDRLVGLLMQRGYFVGAGKVLAGSFASHIAGLPGVESTVGHTLLREARALIERGEFTSAEPLLRECLTARRGSLPVGHWLIAEAMSVLGQALLGQGEFAEAEPLLLRGYEGMRDDPEASTERTRQTVEQIIHLYEAWDKPDQAATWHRSADGASGPNDKGG